MNAARRKKAAALLDDLRPLIDAAKAASAARVTQRLAALAEEEWEAIGIRRITHEGRALNAAERSVRLALQQIVEAETLLASASKKP
jgi:hypothetical protein